MRTRLFSTTLTTAALLALHCGGAIDSGDADPLDLAAAAAPATTLGEKDDSVIPPLTLATGGAHACAVKNGGVKCWGNNRWGQLGLGPLLLPLPAGCIDPNDPYQGIYCRLPLQVKGLTSGVKKVVTADYTTCALLSNGTVKCWGSSKFGQVGIGTGVPAGCRRDPEYSYIVRCDEPVTVVNLSGATDLAAGLDHFCARVSSGAVKCWGNNQIGQMGIGWSHPAECEGQMSDGRALMCRFPVQVQGISGATAVRSFSDFSCATYTAGGVTGGLKCWGGNGGAGAFGVGKTVPAGCVDGNGDKIPDICTTATAVTGLSGITKFSTGGAHACAVVGSGLKCWGSHINGELGIGNNVPAATCFDLYNRGRADGCFLPTTVPGLSGVTAVKASWGKTYAITTGGALKAWGTTELYALGIGADPYPAQCVDQDGLIVCRAPVAVPGLGSGVASVQSHHFLGCVSTTAGRARCFGMNQYGSLGVGLTTPPECTDDNGDGFADWCLTSAPVAGY